MTPTRKANTAEVNRAHGASPPTTPRRPPTAPRKSAASAASRAASTTKSRAARSSAPRVAPAVAEAQERHESSAPESCVPESGLKLIAEASRNRARLSSSLPPSAAMASPGPDALDSLAPLDTLPPPPPEAPMTGAPREAAQPPPPGRVSAVAAPELADEPALPPAAKTKLRPPARELAPVEAVDQLTQALEDRVAKTRDAWMHYRVLLTELGMDRATALVVRAREIQASGGLLVVDESERRRTLGGVFFALAREELGPVKWRELRAEARRHKYRAPPAPPPKPLRFEPEVFVRRRGGA